MIKSKSSESLFESTRMSFGEHLDELRKVLVRSMIGIGIGTLIGMAFSNQVVEILKAPLVRAMEKFQRDQDAAELAGTGGWLPPDLLPWLDEDHQSPQTVYVDPGELVGAIRTVQPEFLAGLQLKSYQFLPKNFKADQAVALCRRLLSPENDLPVQRQRLELIWELLPTESRTEIQRIGQSTSATPSDLDSLTAIFNGLLESRKLSESAAFSGLLAAPSATAKWLFGSNERNPLQEMYQSLQTSFNDETNRRLNRAVLAAVFVREMQPLKVELAAIRTWQRYDPQPQALSVTEPFMIWMKAGIISGIILSSPYVFYQIWLFVAAGLYPHEKTYVHIYLPISLLLFLAGILLAYFFVFDPVLQFLFSFNASLGIALETRINDWLGFVMLLPLGFGIAFQLPLVMLFLNRLGVFSIEAYLSKWRIAVMVIFVVAMVLTPADPISMILLAVPLTGLYFVGVALCRWMPGRRAKPFADVPEPA